MKALVRTSILLGIVGLVVPAASAGGFGWHSQSCYDPCYRVTYYQPTYYWPDCPTTGVIARPAYATQRPAPASPEQINEAPKAKPTVSESSMNPNTQRADADVAFYNSYYVATETEPNANFSNDTCSVAFWNLSPRPVTLRINGQTQTVDRTRSLTLDLPRKFVWQLGERNPESTQVAEGQKALEIVIRR